MALSRCCSTISSAPEVAGRPRIHGRAGQAKKTCQSGTTAAAAPKAEMCFSIQLGPHPECRGGDWNRLLNKWREGVPIGADWDRTPGGFPRYSLANGTTTAFSAAAGIYHMWMADPHVISALRAKRAELSGELIAAEKRILQLRDDISSLDRTIQMFDPTAEPHTIRPILRRKKPTLRPKALNY